VDFPILAYANSFDESRAAAEVFPPRFYLLTTGMKWNETALAN